MEKQPIRVAHIIGKMVGGGVESFVMNYYRNIDRRKIQFDFIIDSDSKIVPKEEIEKLGGRIIEIPPYQHIFKYVRELKKVLKKNKYKIVHSHLNSLSVFPLFCAWSEKIPVRIAHSHSTTNKMERKKNFVKNILKPFSKLFATEYFACSEHAGRWLFGNKSFEQNDVNVIHNAIEVEKFKFNENVRKRVREEYDFQDKFVIGHVGRFVKQKNHEFLIDVFNLVVKEKENAVLILIGEGPLEDRIKNKVKKFNLEGKVYFLGIRDDVNELMQAMDCFLFPSLYEGLGIVAIEAQFAGVNCICSTEVPKETQISEKIRFLELNNSIECWKEMILNICDLQKERYKLFNELSNIYDINKEAKRLEEKYINYCFNKE